MKLQRKILQLRFDPFLRIYVVLILNFANLPKCHVNTILLVECQTWVSVPILIYLYRYWDPAISYEINPSNSITQPGLMITWLCNKIN